MLPTELHPTKEEILHLFHNGIFFPNFDFVMWLDQNLETITMWWTLDGRKFSVDMALEYLAKYSNNCRYNIMYYTHVWDEIYDSVSVIKDRGFEMEGKYPNFNFSALRAFFYTIFWTYYGNFKKDISENVRNSIAWNIAFLGAAELCFYKFLSFKLNSQEQVSVVDLNQIASSFLDSFIFVDWIVKGVNIKMKEMSFLKRFSTAWFENDDYFYTLFQAKDIFYRINNVVKINDIESLIEKHFLINPESYWGFHFYKFKYTYSLKIEYLDKLVGFCHKLLSKNLIWIDQNELNFYIQLGDFVRNNDIEQLDKKIHELENSRKLNGHYSEIIESNSLIVFLKILSTGLKIKINSRDRQKIPLLVKEISGLANEFSYKIKYDFHWLLSFRFDLYRLLLEQESNNINLIEEIDFIKEIISCDFLHQKQERFIFKTILEIFEAKRSGTRYIPEDLYLRFVDDLDSLSFEGGILFVIIYYLRSKEIRKMNESDEINHYIYEAMRFMEEDVTKYKKLWEEDIRSELVLMLKMLNLWMKRAEISAESKNANGKTDILIKTDNEVYVYECLIWGWADAYGKKYEQLLWYLTPSNRYCWLISFVTRHENYLNVLEDLSQVIKRMFPLHSRIKEYQFQTEQETTKHSKLYISHHINYLKCKR